MFILNVKIWKIVRFISLYKYMDIYAHEIVLSFFTLNIQYSLLVIIQICDASFMLIYSISFIAFAINDIHGWWIWFTMWYDFDPVSSRYRIAEVIANSTTHISSHRYRNPIRQCPSRTYPSWICIDIHVPSYVCGISSFSLVEFP